MALFTTENAAIMGKQGAIARWSKPEPEQPAAIEPPKPEPIADLTPREAELACVRDQLDSLNQQLKDCTDPDTWDALTRSKERLFRIWARLAQIPMDPKPVVQKQAKAVQSWSAPTPVEPAQGNPGPVQGQQ